MEGGKEEKEENVKRGKEQRDPGYHIKKPTDRKKKSENPSQTGLLVNKQTCTRNARKWVSGLMMPGPELWSTYFPGRIFIYILQFIAQ